MRPRRARHRRADERRRHFGWPGSAPGTPGTRDVPAPCPLPKPWRGGGGGLAQANRRTVVRAPRSRRRPSLIAFPGWPKQRHAGPPVLPPGSNPRLREPPPHASSRIAVASPQDRGRRTGVAGGQHRADVVMTRATPSPSPLSRRTRPQTSSRPRGVGGGVCLPAREASPRRHAPHQLRAVCVDAMRESYRRSLAAHRSAGRPVAPASRGTRAAPESAPAAAAASVSSRATGASAGDDAWIPGAAPSQRLEGPPPGSHTGTRMRRSRARSRRLSGPRGGRGRRWAEG